MYLMHIYFVFTAVYGIIIATFANCALIWALYYTFSFVNLKFFNTYNNSNNNNKNNNNVFLLCILFTILAMDKNTCIFIFNVIAEC